MGAFADAASWLCLLPAIYYGSRPGPCRAQRSPGRSAACMGIVIAGADFGSNKTGYIVAEVKAGELFQLDRDSRFTRLAEGVDEKERLCGAAVARTLAWCEELRERMKKHGVTRFRAVG